MNSISGKGLIEVREKAPVGVREKNVQAEQTASAKGLRPEPA